MRVPGFRDEPFQFVFVHTLRLRAVFVPFHAFASQCLDGIPDYQQRSGATACRFRYPLILLSDVRTLSGFMPPTSFRAATLPGVLRTKTTL